MTILVFKAKVRPLGAYSILLIGAQLLQMCLGVQAPCLRQVEMEGRVGLPQELCIHIYPGTAKRFSRQRKSILHGSIWWGKLRALLSFRSVSPPPTLRLPPLWAMISEECKFRIGYQFLTLLDGVLWAFGPITLTVYALLSLHRLWGPFIGCHSIP